MRSITALLGLLALLAGTGPAAAEYPDKPIRIMAPYAPGGNIDVTPSSNAVAFTATKLAGDVGCAEVLSKFSKGRGRSRR